MHVAFPPTSLHSIHILRFFSFSLQFQSFSSVNLHFTKIQVWLKNQCTQALPERKNLTKNLFVYLNLWRQVLRLFRGFGFVGWSVRITILYVFFFIYKTMTFQIYRYVEKYLARYAYKC